MDQLLQDLRYAVRTLAQAPGFTIVAILTLAVGIGANAAIFSVVNAVLLKPVPFPDPDRLVMFMNTNPQGSGSFASPAKFQHWRDQTRVVENVAAFRNNIVNFTGGGVPEQLRAGEVTAEYFRLLGAPVFQGRTFSAEETHPGGERVVVLSHSLWRRRFASNPNLIGTTMLLSGDPHTVVGIIGPAFDVGEFGPPLDAWIPFQLDPDSNDQGHYFRAAGRLKAGVTLEQANAQLDRSAGDYRRKFPRALNDNESFGVTPFQEAFVSDVRQTLLVLAGAVGFVLLIACANVANLLLVRATGRR